MVAALHRLVYIGVAFVVCSIIALFGQFVLGPAFHVRTERRPLAVAVGADGQQRGVGIGHDHADHRVVTDQFDPLHAAAVAAHRAGVGLLEADRHAVSGG